MNQFLLRFRAGLLLLAASLTGMGCGGLGRELSWSAEGPMNEDRPLTMEEHRTRFLQDRDPKSIRWLLAHRVKQGMTVVEVGNILGEDGERDPLEHVHKRNGGNYRESDVGYKWGPDRERTTYCLFFREGRLVNYNPEEFE